MTYGGTGGYLGTGTQTLQTQQNAQNADALRSRDAQSAAKTCSQTATIPTKSAIDVRAAASSTKARNMVFSLNEQRT
jgi:hypothetical protein